jgi:hypothetical protein
VGTQWARVRATASFPLRRGGWYRVVSETELEVMVSALGRQITVPRAAVELRTTPPNEWSVVRSPAISPDRTPTHFRSGYMVCPGCQDRIALPPAAVPGRTCPRCQQTFPIAWSERYLEEPTPPAEGG